MASRTAVLEGTRRNPSLRLRFARFDRIGYDVRLPTYPKPKRRPGGRNFGGGKPQTLLDWVKALPGRRFDKDTATWIVTDPGLDADRVFTELGFEVDLSRGARAGITALTDLATPWIELDPEDPWVTRVNTRFSGLTEALPAGAVWNKDLGMWEVHTPDLRAADPRLGVPPDIKDLGDQLVAALPTGDLGTDPNPRWPAIFGRMPRAPKRLPHGMPELPPWAGITLFGYQLSGCYSILGGHRLLADSPGLGKTFASIAAHAAAGTQRLLVVSPPVALTNWGREVLSYGLAWEPPKVKKGQTPPAPPRPGIGTLAIIRPGRKVPELPERGVVIVPDSLLAARPALVDQLRAWAPDGITVDESHRLKTWDSTRSRAVRRIAMNVPGLRVPISGTAMLASPIELASQLAISGHLDTVFGGLAEFLHTYGKEDAFGGWKPRVRALPRLRELLDEHVWVRRRPVEVYNRTEDGPSLPPVLPPRAVYVDVDLAGYRAALDKQLGVIDEWLDDFTAPRGWREPTEPEIEEFTRESIRFISPLRKAAAVAKVDAAVEYVHKWVGAEREDDRPLLVWCHHQEVAGELARAMSGAGIDFAAIDGSTSATNRGRIVGEFQGGKYQVLLLSLHAAGVAITLTRAADNLMVETDWTPAILSQARDRTARLGQKRAVTLTTLVAPGTLDEHLQRVQRNKAKDLDVVMGEGNDTSVVETETDDLATPRQIVEEMVRERIAARLRANRRAA
ncbi:DEAD/DEAH box helicase [Pseudactinotalea terrae]|uniref:helicase-related protein n=1 Tax=Pseudactinotalea terrae TaxID=1743262 RepID=UPI0012E14A6E|nr:DEAD/DEAH box helicase [Pseudactinotalea terrae]